MRMIECRWFGGRGGRWAALLGVTTYGSFLASVVGRLYRIVDILGAFSRHSHEQICIKSFIAQPSCYPDIIANAQASTTGPAKWSHLQERFYHLYLSTLNIPAHI